MTLHPTAASESSPTLKTRMHKPLNVEASFLNPHNPITANEHFFIRDHFPVPKLDPGTWKLEICGEVKKPMTFSLADLKAMPSTTVTCVLECAGNGRLFLPNIPEGVQWGLGAVGCATWTGVRLADVIALAGLKKSTVDLVFEGADHGIPERQYKPKNEIHYSRSIPIATASEPQVLLAWQMNGEDLPEAHGAPVRLIVPGWYSVSSVKWLTRIIALASPFKGYFQTVEYTYWNNSGKLPPEHIPITELFLKSQIAHPVMHQQVLAGETCRIHGAAWASASPISKVEVSTDKGSTWQSTRLDRKSTTQPHMWRLWHFDWKPATIGNYILMSRAIDAGGNVQPSQHNDDHESYLIHHTLPIPIEVV